MSLFEMIPDRQLIMPAGAHTERQDAQKRFGLHERVCAYCGAMYYRRAGEREYIRHKNKKELRFCTWSHLCRWEEETPKEERTTTKGRKRMPTQVRIDKMMREMARIRAELDSEAGQALSADERNRMHSRIRWRASEVRRLLEEMGNEGACGVRGIAGGDERTEAPGA